MPQNYDLKVGSIYIGNLSAPTSSDTSRTGARATFTPLNRPSMEIPGFNWKNFNVNLSEPVNGLPQGAYRFRKAHQVVRGIGQELVPNNPLRLLPWEASWNARLNIYELELGDTTFGFIDQSEQGVVRFHTPDNGNNQVILPTFDWKEFRLTINVQSGPWLPSTIPYQFLQGHFTQIFGEGTKPGNRPGRDEPTSWEATARVVR